MTTKHPAVERPALVTASGLRRRGWTASLIRDFCPAASEVRKNPRYACAPPMRLYPLAEVERVESSGAFLAAKAAAARRAASARRAVETKRSATEAAVAGMGVAVPVLCRAYLERCACDHYNGRLRDDQAPADERSNPAFLARICVNYLRHRLTRYEDHLDSVRGAVGVRDAYLAIKSRVLDAIAVKYEWLAEECEAQKLRAAAEAASA